MGGFLRSLFSLIFAFSQSFFVVASESAPVRLNEVMANPASGGDWVELYNFTDEEQDLAGWQLDDQEGGSAPVDLEGVIESWGFLVVEMANRLNNSGDQVRLINRQGQAVDLFSYNQAGRGSAFALDSAGVWFETTQPTPGQVNGQPQSPLPTDLPSPSPETTPSPTASPAATLTPAPTLTPTPTPTPTWLPTPTPAQLPSLPVWLSEFLANPGQGEEWVELYNPNETSVWLTGWQIDDQAYGGSPALKLSGEIAARSFRVFSLGTRLNNNGDSIRLIDPDGLEVEQFTFGVSQTEVAWAKDDLGNWQQTTTSTPGGANVIDSPYLPEPIFSSSLTPRPAPDSDPPNSSPLPIKSAAQLKLGEKTGPVTPAAKTDNALLATKPVKLPDLGQPWCARPDILAGHAEKPQIAKEASGPRRNPGFLVWPGGLLWLISSLLLIDRENVIRFGREFASGLATRLNLVFGDLPPFEHPEDLARRQSHG